MTFIASTQPMLMVLGVVGFVVLFVGLYAWAVGRGRKYLTEHLNEAGIEITSMSFRLFPPAKLIVHSRKRAMWFTITRTDGGTTHARVMMSFITGNSVKLFD
ncbi:MAG: hypothetical protein HN350_20345 [Phycisphaerales bacterium]|nr:hypothetical protein [Phycisphaerales bacterium]